MVGAVHTPQQVAQMGLHTVFIDLSSLSFLCIHNSIKGNGATETGGSDAVRTIRGGTPLGMEGSLSMKSASEGTGKRVADSGLGSGSGASSGGGTGGRAAGGDDGVCAFCQDDDEVMMCPLCSCRRCFGKQDPSLALLCEVRMVCLSVFLLESDGDGCS